MYLRDYGEYTYVFKTDGLSTEVLKGFQHQALRGPIVKGYAYVKHGTIVKSFGCAKVIPRLVLDAINS